MKRISIIIVSLCIGGVIAYLYRDYTAGKDYKIVEVPAIGKTSKNDIPLIINDSGWDRLMEEMMWNEMEGFGPV